MTTSTVNLYDNSNIETLAWPNTVDGDYAKRFLIPIIKNGVSHYIDNIETTMMALTIDDIVLPITINEHQYQNAYVCSPYGHYIAYAKETLGNFKNRWIGTGILSLIWGLEKIVKAGNINKVVIVNNWLFSTGLYPKISSEQITAIQSHLNEHFPQHAILMRSIHTYQCDAFYKALKKNRFDLIGSRQVYFMNTLDEKIFRARMLKSDAKLLRESSFEVLHNSEIPLQEAAQIADLYRSVYVDRYSKLNPQYNANFIKLVLENQILELKALKKDGRIYAVAGYVCRNGVMNSPFLGHDTSMSQEHKLYHLISATLIMEAKKLKMVYHLSSGATAYKKIRRAESNIEYMAVYHRHLPFSGRLPWLILKGLMNGIGIPFLKYYDSQSVKEQALKDGQ